MKLKTQYYTGLDIHKKSISYCVRRRRLTATLPNSGCILWSKPG